MTLLDEVRDPLSSGRVGEDQVGALLLAAPMGLLAAASPVLRSVLAGELRHLDALLV